MDSDTTASATAHARESLFETVGPSATVVSDNGPPFNSKEMQNFYSKLNIVHLTSSPFRHARKQTCRAIRRSIQGNHDENEREEGKEKRVAFREFLRYSGFSKFSKIFC